MPTEQATLLIASIGRPSLLATLRGACLGSQSRLAEVLLLDDSPGTISGGEIRDCTGGVPVRILRRGPGVVARNLLLDEARTDVVCLTDDDCLPDPRWVVELTSYLSSQPGVAAAFGRVVPTPRPGARIRETVIDGVGTVAWGECGTGDDLLFCPAVSAPSWQPGIASLPASVPWAIVGSSNNLGIRRSRLLAGRPAFLPSLGPGSPAGSGEDTELGYALMAAGRPVAYVPSALVLHDSWLDVQQATRRRRSYFRGNTEALAFHALRGDTRAAGLLMSYWAHFCAVNGFGGPREVLEWAYGTATSGPAVMPA